MAPQQPAYPSGAVEAICSRSRETSRGWPSAKSGVNQRSTTESATAPVPSARTRAARSRQFRGGPMYGAVASRARRSMRSGWWMASHWPTMPPMDSPA